MKAMLFISILITVTFVSCGQESQSDVSNLIQEKALTWENVEEVSVNELEFVQDLTVQDSLNLLSNAFGALNSEYESLLASMNASSTYALKSRDKMYFPGGKLNEYHKGQFEKYLKEAKEKCKSVNDIGRCINGDFTNNEYAHTNWTQIYGLRQRQQDEVIGKVYKAVLTYKEIEYKTYGGEVSGTNYEMKTEVYYFILSSNESSILEFIAEEDAEDKGFNLSYQPSVELLDFKSFHITDEGRVEEIPGASSNQIEAESVESENKVDTLIYRGSEYYGGSCMDNFETLSGEEITWWNVNFGTYHKEDEYDCGTRAEFVNRTFIITHHTGSIKLHTEEGNEEIEDEIVVDIELIK